MEMDIEEGIEVGDLLKKWDNVQPGDQVPPRRYTASTGAVLDVTEIAGFQHYITPEYAKWRAEEDWREELENGPVPHVKVTFRLTEQAAIADAQKDGGFTPDAGLGDRMAMVRHRIETSTFKVRVALNALATTVNNNLSQGFEVAAVEEG